MLATLLFIGFSCLRSRPPQNTDAESTFLAPTDGEGASAHPDVDPSLPSTPAVPLDQQLIAHEPTACTDLAIDSSNGLKQLSEAIETIQRPAWAGMRAGQCIVELYPVDGEALFIEWMSEEDTMGLAYMVANKLGSLPPDAALTVAQAGLYGPHAQGIAERLADSQTEEVRALLEQWKGTE